MPHLSVDEVNVIEKMRRQGKNPNDILCQLIKTRGKRGIAGPSSSAVYRFLNGETYQRSEVEERGRKTSLPPRLVQVGSEQRRKLIKAAANEYLVTWADVHKATKKALRARGLLTKTTPMPSLDWFARLVRENADIRARPGKTRITHTAEYEKKRYKQGLKWKKFGKTFWRKGIHAYIDNKKFVCPRNAKERKLFRATKIRHHLRTPSEGQEAMFKLPKRGHMLSGIPSIEVTAAVGQDGIIMWHINDGWNGEKAATMYAKLGAVLRSKYGNKRKFNVVEDGDPKGYQSGKGVAAKAEQRIESWKLPPRSPGWMPLDYSLWHEIERRTLAKNIQLKSKVAYGRNLRKTALSLRPSLVHACLDKMKGNIDETVRSFGKHTKMD